MSEQYPGGYVTKSPVVPNGTTAPGLWNLSQQAYYQSTGTWPPVLPVDAQFNYVTMLLHGDGTNGAQNNTFLDSSSNAFTITRNGNTTQGSFSPYGSNWSNYFLYSATSYLDIAGGSTLALGTGDFTIELWINPASYPQRLFGWTASNDTAFGSEIDSSGKVWIGGWTTGNYSTATITLNVWTHLAYTRASGVERLFINGVLDTSATRSTNYSSTTNLSIGRWSNTTTPTDGYISNFRLVKGTALYTSSFTPSVVPLTAVSGTQVLTCQSNRFVDNSSNAFAITTSGTPSVKRFNPFGTSTAYSTATIGGSGYFDGTTDWLSVPNNTAFDMGSGDFTIEGWFYQTGNGYLQEVIAKYEASYQASFSVELDATTLGAYVFYGSTSYLTVYSGTPPKLNTWNHFALQRNGSYNEFYLNGVRLAQVAAQTMRTTTSAVRIGDLGAGYTGYGFQGHISDIRVRKGTATYSGTTYTVPTAPLTAVSNTVLLCNMTNGAIYDNAMMNDLETVGNAQISTSVKKYGTGSMYFDGTGDYLISKAALPRLKTSDFTIEWWEYRTSTGNDKPVMQGSGAYANNDPIFGYSGSSNNLMYLSSNGSSWDMFSGFVIGSIDLNTWNHFAVTRSGSTFRGFKNGVLTTTGTSSSSIYQSTDGWSVGIAQVTSQNFQGYIDDLRITVGYARYTTTFTPPTAAFPNIGPT